MMGVLIAVVVIVGVALAVALYMTTLSSVYPEVIRTNEVFHIRTNDLWVLRVCRYRKSRAPGEPVLLVHGMGANQNNFTAPPDGCLVDYLSEKGYDCWTVDLRGCKSSQPPFERTRNDVRLEDFFTEDLPAVIRHILKTTNYPKVHWVGHSMGGMLLYAYAQAHGGDEIASGTTLGSPIDFSDAADNIPASLLGFGIKAPALAGNLVRGAVPILKGLGIGLPAFPINIKNLPKTIHAGHFINMLEDPLPGLMTQVRHWLRNKDYKLFDGEMDVVAGLPDLQVPLLAFYAAVDPFINAERALKCFESIKIEDKQAVLCAKDKGFVEDYNHCDLAFGKEAAREIFEPILRWLQAHVVSQHVQSEEEVQRISATVLSPEKRANILSGAAYARVVTTDTPNDAPEPPETGADEGAELSGVDVQQDAAFDATQETLVAGVDAQHLPDGSEVVSESHVATEESDALSPAKKKAASRKKPTVKKQAAKKAPAKKTAAKKAPAKKSVAAKKTTAKAKTAPKKKSPTKSAKGDEPEVSPEAQAWADKSRESRNSSFSEIMSTLEEGTEKK